LQQDVSTPDDAELVAAALAGGPKAFGPIVERYQDAVFGVALARLGDFHEAQDAAQAVFIEAFERLESLREPAKLGAWLRKIAIHRSLDMCRRRGKLSDVAEVPEPKAPDETHRRELREEVLAAVAKLGKAQREAITGRLSWEARRDTLKQIGARGVEGFVRALQSGDWRHRRNAIQFEDLLHAPQSIETIIEMLKRALTDRNKKVRGGVAGLMQMDVPAERKVIMIGAARAGYQSSQRTGVIQVFVTSPGDSFRRFASSIRLLVS
jgi:RNA polymerase sigma-70 factor (ECF subfamily)